MYNFSQCQSYELHKTLLVCLKLRMPPPINLLQKKELIKLGKKVKSIREKKGLTLEFVANRVGKDRQSIHRLEKGDFNPSYIYLLEVCKGLEIGIEELFMS